MQKLTKPAAPKAPKLLSTAQLRHTTGGDATSPPGGAHTNDTDGTPVARYHLGG